jgi:hypothetical protein
MLRIELPAGSHEVLEHHERLWSNLLCILDGYARTRASPIYSRMITSHTRDLTPPLTWAAVSVTLARVSKCPIGRRNCNRKQASLGVRARLGDIIRVSWEIVRNLGDDLRYI